MSKQRINDIKSKKTKCLFGNELEDKLDSIKENINILSNSIERERERESKITIQNMNLDKLI